MLIRGLVNAVALVMIAYFYQGLQVDGFGAALLAGLLLGLVNAFIRPLVVIFTLPLTILTFGLFSFVINALMLLLVAAIVPGFGLDGFFAAVIASLLLAVISAIVSRLVLR